MLTRSEVLEYLRHMQRHYEVYQNHKETMAWAGVALYYVLLTGSVVAASHCVSKLAAFTVLAIATLVVAHYVRTQSFLKRRAARADAACSSLYRELVANELCIADMDFSNTPLDEWGTSPYFLPKCVQLTMAEFDKRGQYPARAIEYSAIALILIGCTIGALLIGFQ